MPNLNRYQITLVGATDSAYTVSVSTITVWTTGIQAIPKAVTDIIKFTGLSTMDFGLYQWTYKIPLIPFGLSATTGHSHGLWLRLLRGVLAKPYKKLTVVSGITVMGDDDATLFWTQELAGGAIDLTITGVDISYPMDDTVTVTLSAQKSKVGV